MRSAETELQNTIELRATASEIVAPKPDGSRRQRKKDDFEALFKRIFRRKITSAKNAFRARLPSKLHRQLIHQNHLQSHLHCGNDPTVANHNGIPSATHPPAPLAIPFTLQERSYSCKSQWNSIGNSSTSTTCNPIYIAGTILQLQITMEFCRPRMHEKHLKPHLQCGTDPTMIRT